MGSRICIVRTFNILTKNLDIPNNCLPLHFCKMVRKNQLKGLYLQSFSEKDALGADFQSYPYK